MEKTIIWQTCTRIFRETFGDAEINIRPETTADDIEGWDSVKHIQLIVSIEKAFGMRFNTGEMAALANVGEMVELIAKRTANK
ncbi:MAG TPA: acyl carrier protein [Candidatus Binatia bacterium]